MKSIDIFGYTPSILMNNKSAYKTWTGTCLTLILVAFSLVLTSVSIEEIVMKNRPLVFQTVFIDKQPEKMTLTSENFYAAGGLEDQKAQYYVDESYYTMKYTQIQNTKEGSQNYNRQETVKQSRRCSEDENHFDTTIFSNNAKDHMYCLGNDSDLEIEGIFGNNSFSLIKIEVDKCNPATSSIKCRSKQEMASKFNGGFFGFDITDNTFDPADSGNAFKKYGNSLFTTIDSTNSKTINIKISRNKGETDYGIIFSSYSSEESYSIDNIDEKMTSSARGNIVTVNLYFSHRRKEFNRSYTKFQTIIANISATAKVLFIVIRITVAPFIKNSFYLEMIGKTNRNIKNVSLGTKNNESVNNLVQPKSTVEIRKPSMFVIKSLVYPCKKNGFNRYFERMKKILQEKHDIAFFRRVKGELNLLKTLFLEEKHRRFIDRINFDEAVENGFKTNSICVYDQFELSELKEGYLRIKRGDTEIDKKIIASLSSSFKNKLE